MVQWGTSETNPWYSIPNLEAYIFKITRQLVTGTIIPDSTSFVYSLQVQGPFVQTVLTNNTELAYSALSFLWESHFTERWSPWCCAQCLLLCFISKLARTTTRKITLDGLTLRYLSCLNNWSLKYYTEKNNNSFSVKTQLRKFKVKDQFMLVW